MAKLNLKSDINQSSLAPFLQKASLGLTQFRERQDLGFPKIPERDALWSQSERIGKDIRSKFPRLVVVGLGGSSMGARTLKEVFGPRSPSHELLICDNVDEIEFARLLGLSSQFSAANESSDLLDKVDSEFLAKTAWLVISKSGSTLETLSAMDLVLTAYEKKGLSLKNHFWIVTEPVDNALAQFAARESLTRAEIPQDVGGRFSVLTPVGMIPAAYLGLSLKDFRKGAQTALHNTELLTQVGALVLQSFELQKDITMFWSYSSHLREFGGWMSQLWAESLGKAQNRKGQVAPRASTPIGAVGACDQHSVLQQVMEGPKNKFVIFQRVSSAETQHFLIKKSHFPEMNYTEGRSLGDFLAAEAQATSQALTEVGVMNCTLELKDLSEEALGELFMFWQMMIGLLGEALDIDAFNQPGVELGKRLARKILKH
jgi:glucose-6-phosphate isomerase